MTRTRTFTAFSGEHRLVGGALPDLLAALREHPGSRRAALVFDDESGELVKLGTAAEIDHALAAADASHEARAPSAELLNVRLLPRHAAWLHAQPGGASAAVRRLVDAARRDKDVMARQAREAAYRFVSMVAGDYPGFEEACRALFAGEGARFDAAAAGWPRDIRDYARRLAGEGLAGA